MVAWLALHHLLYLALVALPLQFLALLNDGVDVIGLNAANQRPYLTGLRYELLVLKVILLFDIVQIGQLLDLLDELRVMLQLGLPLVQVHLLQYLQQIDVEVEVALVPSRTVVLQYLLLVLHRTYITNKQSSMSLLSPRFELAQKRPRQRTMFALPPDKWYDVQDEDGVWRVGYCQKTEPQHKIISLDGFHPSHAAYYCDHSGKIAPIRTHTRGLTVPQTGKTLRRVISLKQVQSIMGKLNLYHLRSNQLENTVQGIRSFLRTELFITVDKIFNTPFEILGTIKLIDIHINKFFITVIEYYLKLLQGSKKFILILDSNDIAIELYHATYEMTLIIEMILGVHKRSKAFYQSNLNRTVTPQGFLDCFVKSEAGILPFKLFFKGASGMKVVQEYDLTICMQTVSLFVSMCQKYQQQFVQGNKYQSTTKIIVEEIINLFKTFCEKNQSLRAKCKEKVEIVSRIQTLYLKLFPNKPCLIRKIIEGDLQQEKQSLRDKLIVQIQAQKKSKFQEKDNQRYKQLQAKINNLETTISKLQTFNFNNQNISIISDKQEIDMAKMPTENMGEQAFLASLQWALQSGDINTCKKLIAWRKSILKLGRIAGWETALAVGIKTFKKKQISYEDIIEANMAQLLKQGSKNK